MSDIAEEKPVSMPILHDPKPGNQTGKLRGILELWNEALIRVLFTEAQPNRKQQFEQYNKLGFRFGVMSSSVSFPPSSRLSPFSTHHPGLVTHWGFPYSHSHGQ